MEMIKVESSNVEAVGYENCMLVVRYANGTYAYSDVPRTEYTNLLESVSKGSYIASNIKGKYSCCKLTD